MAYALQTTKLSKQFGDLTILNSIDLAIKTGARHALIGPNGAGKTTLLNLLSGLEPASSGSVFLDDYDISQLPAHQRCRRGLVRTFQINQLFPEMTVLEAVMMAANESLGRGGHWWRAVDANPVAHEQAMHLLETLHLLPQAHTTTTKLAYGQQRLVEIALALATKPRVLLLDEPAAGVSAHEVRQLFECIARLPKALTILLIEHDMELVFQFADHVSVLAEGCIIAQGLPSEIANDPHVQNVYLGHLPHD